DPMRKFRQCVRGCGRNENSVGFLSDSNVFHVEPLRLVEGRLTRLGLPERSEHLPSAQASQGKRCDESLRIRRHHHLHLSAAALQFAYQLRRFIRCDPATHTEENLHRVVPSPGRRMLSISRVSPTQAATATSAPARESLTGPSVC